MKARHERRVQAMATGIAIVAAAGVVAAWLLDWPS